MVRNIKLGGLFLLGLVVVIFIAQNTAPVNIQFLFWEFSTSAVALLILTLALGFCFGLAAASWITKTSSKRKPPPRNDAIS